MKSYVLFDENGLIKGSASGSVLACGDHGMVESDPKSASTHYVDWMRKQVEGRTIKFNPFVTERPAMQINVDRTQIPADGKTAANMAGIPEGAVIYIDSDSHTADGTQLEFTADHVGTYTIRIEFFPYIPFTITIEATQ